MSNFKQDINNTAADLGEEIESIVVGKLHSWRDDPRDIPVGNIGQLMTWEKAAPFLDYEYDTGYGGEDCPAITAWTKSHVLFVVHYDGATWVSSIPRHPVLGHPQMYGGG